MIQLPRRSVTRFFIPLIDVLTLLFCIFLIMPTVQRPGADAAEQEPTNNGSHRAKSGEPGALATGGAAELARERQELERLRKEKIEVLQQRLLIQVVEIDGDTGKLYYNGPERAEIGNQAEAQRFVNEVKQKAGSREPFFLILFPRQRTGYPEQGQVNRYEQWFKDVAHAFDNPRGREG